MGTAMATFAYNHTGGDAGFRTWGKGISDVIKAAGAVQTADTGQIDWATVLNPGASVGGYEIFKLTDSVGDLYIKIGYGGYSQIQYPSLHLRISTMPSDGAMNFPDLAHYRDIGVLCMGAVSSTALRNTYVCVTGTTMSIQVEQLAIFVIERRRDRVTGLLTSKPDFVVVEAVGNANGYVFTSVGPSVSGYYQAIYRMEPSYTYGPHREFSFVPWAITTSGTPDKNIYRWYAPFPATHILIGGVSYIASEITPDTIFSCAPVGGISHTYRASGRPGCANTNDATYAAALIWE
jgi:hypothetical protein